MSINDLKFVAKQIILRILGQFSRYIRQDLPHRRRDIFDFAFHKGKFEIALEAAERLSDPDWSLRRRVYRSVAEMPSPVNRYVGKLVAGPSRLQTFMRRRFGGGKVVKYR